jgi:hypothetical protein
MNRQIVSGAIAAAVAGALLLGGCASSPAPTNAGTPAPTSAGQPAASATQAAQEVKTLFAALPEDGRLYYFTDSKLYFIYLNTEEVALRQTRIGAGPAGQTVVFALSDADVKAKEPGLAERLYDGKIPADAKGFYGEVFKDGRFYVFDHYPDMKAFIEHGEVGLAITDIGAGPKGETLVWVLNNDSAKKGRPTARIEQFKALRGMK